jgi:signal transduction histidine kinase
MAVALENARLYTAAQQELHDRKSAEAALRQSETMLREHAGNLAVHNAELDAFAHTVAHDLKQPLTMLRGYATLLEDGGAENEAQMREYCRRIDASADKMNNIINALLLLAKIRQWDEVEQTPLDMAQITSEALQRLTQLIQKNNADIVIPDTWPAARGYAPWIEEIWANYISNAIKYGGDPPQVELGATLMPTHNGSNANSETTRVRFWVRDNGDGLTEEQQAHLFIPFERLDQTRIQGDGLGLSIVHRIMKKLGGNVGVESTGEPGEGSTFYFELPAAAS